MFFCSTFAYTLLQNLKDSIIVTRVGAEALPFLEAYGVLPVSLAFFMLYNRLNHVLPEKYVYQAALVPFLCYYTLFGAVLYPNAALLHPTHLLAGMQAALPAGLVGLASMVVHWSYSLFFIMGELWGGVAISLLFWGLADEVCTVREAESVYPLLGILANIGLVLAGAWVKHVNGSHAALAQLGLLPMQALLATVLVMAGGLMAAKSFVYARFVKHDPAHAKPARSKKKDKKKPKSLGESLAVLKHSPKVGNLAVLVISYFISQKLFDFAWKAQLRVMYPSPEAVQQVLAEVAQWTGVATIALMTTSKFVFRYGGWSAAALATPVAILISGVLFFASAIVMQGGGAGVLSPQLVAALIAVGAVAGKIGRVASRAPKYSLFDPAKEMVYITMSKQEKNEGKAAVDLLGSYFGKSGASWIMQALVLGLGSLTRAMPIIALVHLSVSLAWTRATFSLADLMAKERREQEAKKAQPGPAEGGPDAAPPGTPAYALASSSAPPSSNGHGKGNGHAYGNGNGNGNGGGGAAVAPVASGEQQQQQSAAARVATLLNGLGSNVLPVAASAVGGLSGSSAASSVTFRAAA